MIQVKGFIVKLIAMVSVMGLISQGFAIAALASYRNEVARSMSRPVSVGPRGEDGTDGVDGKNVTQKQVDSAVAKYLAANPPKQGKTGAQGPVGKTGKTGKSGKTGKTGARGPGPTSAQIRAAVNAWMRDHPPDVNITNCAVEPGKDIVGLSVTVVAGNFVAVCVKASVHTHTPDPKERT